MKSTVTAFIDSLLLYDYLLFGAVVLLFILLLMLAIVLRKRLLLSIITIIMAFALLVAGPVVGYVKLHDYLFKTRLDVSEARELEFTDALVVRGTLTNASTRTFSHCKVTAGAYKVTGYAAVDWVFPFNPFARSYEVIDGPIEPGASAEFKLLIEPFYYENDYNITTGADCR